MLAWYCQNQHFEAWQQRVLFKKFCLTQKTLDSTAFF
jgi:hypothetical protein